MASKNRKKNTQPDHTNIKWVKKAGMWCTTTVTEGKFAREWTKEKP